MDPSQTLLTPGAVFAELVARTGGEAQTASAAGIGDPNRCLALVYSCDEVADPEHAFFGPLARAVFARAQERNADVFACFPPRGAPNGATREAVDRCLRRGVSGIVVLGLVAEHDDGFVRRANRVPIVFVEYDPLERGAGFVGIDNARAMQKVVRHLASLGHRRIAHIAGLPSTRSGLERRLGFEQAIGDLGLPLPADYVQDGDFYPLSGHAAMQRLLALPEPPDAVACASDMQAIGALVALEDARLTCPGDVAVTGFDDAEFAARLAPALTTIGQSPAALGADAVDAVVEMITFPRTAPAVLRDGELVVRESCGAGTLVRG